ncbi:MAG: hypothetical protein HYZ85_05665 [Candidatus Omnitrophica bacterium]|nr:hypothetical protein [Candidatus Omnitrophota bacterium]
MGELSMARDKMQSQRVPGTFSIKRYLVPFGLFLAFPFFLHAEESSSPVKTDISGYLKTLNFFTRTTSLSPELVNNPLAVEEIKEDLFQNLERVRLQMRAGVKLPLNQRLVAKVDYDHQAFFGSFVHSDNFRYRRWTVEERQFGDLSQTLVKKRNAFYEHRLYRAYLTYETEKASLTVGRQQIPWGLGHFFTPTDVFNPFNPTQIEWDERDGTDAVNLAVKLPYEAKTQWIYTPRGARSLHPQRFFNRTSRDVKGYEIGVINGLIHRDFASGFDLRGNVKDSAVRGEFLYRHKDNEEKDFMQFTVNADYNLPKNIYMLLEYHFNGLGRRSFRDYQRDLQTRGDFTQLARNYLGLLLGYDITALLRLEHRTLFNMDDVSFFIRPELQYEVTSNLLATLGAQLFLGANQDEYGAPANLYFGEMKYNF